MFSVTLRIYIKEEGKSQSNKNLAFGFYVKSVFYEKRSDQTWMGWVSVSGWPLIKYMSLHTSDLRYSLIEMLKTLQQRLSCQQSLVLNTGRQGFEQKNLDFGTCLSIGSTQPE